MKKYHLWVVLLCFYCSTHLQAQTVAASKKDSTRWDIGFNTTPLFVTLLNSDATISIGDYPLIIRHFNAEQTKALRLGFGLDINKDKSNINGSDVDNYAFQINTKIGRERFFPLSKRWSGTLGGDVLLKYRLNRSTTTNFEKTLLGERHYMIGGAATVGVLFHLTPALRLGTEGGLTAILDFSKQKTEFSDLPQLDTSNSATEFSASLGVPRLLYLYWLF